MSSTESGGGLEAGEDQCDRSDRRLTKRARYDRCFSGIDFSMDSGPLKDLDSEKLKREIKRWAKAVVAYARQLSGSFGSRQRERSDT